MKFSLKIFPTSGFRNFFLTSLLLLLSAGIMHSQDFLKELGKAFKQGKAGDIAAHFDKNVDLFFSEKTTTYTKKEAEQVIRKFFTQVEPTDFMKTNDGASQANNTIFYIGTLNTSYGSYQVYMFFVLKNATYYIRELRFEKK